MWLIYEVFVLHILIEITWCYGNTWEKYGKVMCIIMKDPDVPQGQEGFCSCIKGNMSIFLMFD